MREVADRVRCGYRIQPCDITFGEPSSHYRVSKDGLSRIIGIGLLEDLDADTDEAFVKIMGALFQMDVPHAIIGQRPTGEQQRAWEAWLRDHPQPPGTTLTAALMNQAIDWWNERTLTRLDAGE